MTLPVCLKDMLSSSQFQASVSLKKRLQQEISEPEFYGDLVYRFSQKHVGKSNFSEQLKKLINRLKELDITKISCGRLHV